MKSTIRAAVLLVIVAAVIAAAIGYSILSRGLSTRTDPSPAEVMIARTMRRLATPAAVRAQANPVEPTADVLAGGLGHFADHCASCHANDGSGQTALGQNLFPKAPDMREAGTQSLSDGELFAIIENGIRLTGMPAWGDGTEASAAGSWGLVHFIRHLPRLTPDELTRMEALNPKSPDQFRQEEEVRRFLAGESDAAPAPATTTPAKPHHQ